MFEVLFGNTVVRKTEKKKKIEGQVAVLKKQQKVESEKVLKDFAAKKTNSTDIINAQITALQAQISSLKETRKSQLEILDEQCKVEYDKVINDFDRKIVSKQNQVKRLGHFIEAEIKNQEDVLNSDKPNAPKRLVESK